MKLTKKNKIVLITLAVVLVALLIVYFTAIAPLLEKEPVVYPIPLDGEGLVGTKLTIYKSIEKEDLVSIKISNEHGNYTFNNVKDEKGNYIGKLKGYEMLEFDEIYYAYLLSFALDPIMVDNEPYRNKIDENGNKVPLTEEDMAKYGVTEDTCSVTMTVTYKDNGVEKTHVLRIGYESFTTNPTYYVAYEGRNTVYRFSSGISCAELNIADYLTPIIFQGYGSVSEAALNIIQFSINSFDKKTGDFKNLVFITGEQYTGGEHLSITHTYHVM